MITMTELSNMWNNITSYPGQSIGRRADENHPLDFFISYNENHNRQLLLLSNFLPPLPSSSQQISIRANLRQDKRYALCFSLADDSLREQFVFLCWDIMNCTYNIKETTTGIKATINRFCMWQKLFAEMKEKTLTDFEIKGLIGELYVLKHVAFSHYSIPTALNGWLGPLGADRDFEFPNTWYEVKSLSLSKDVVTISSVDQLDSDTDGILFVCRIEKTSQNKPGNMTLNSLVSEIRNTLLDPDERRIFDSKLSFIHYDPSAPNSSTPYVLHKIEMYEVKDDFPRITRHMLPSAISNCTYNLTVSGIQPWRLDKKL